MRRYGIICVCMVALLSGLHIPAAKAEVGVGIDFFYDRLAAYGTWVERPHYGLVWYPAGAGVGWRPYTRGHWIFTDEYGWYWVSDFAWGWAPFHYGRWVLDNDYGWVWVPGYDWGPAWVAWRTGGGYMGWAPLPPDVGFQAGSGLALGHFDLSVGIAQPAWVFVEEHDFLRPRIHTVMVAPARNVTIIHQTTNVTNYITVNNRIVNRSVTTEYVQRATRQPVKAVQVQEVGTAAKQGEQSRNHVVNIFRPAVKPAPAKQTPRMVQEKIRRQNAEANLLHKLHRKERRQLDRVLEQERHSVQIPAELLQRQPEAERQYLQREQELEHHALQQRQTVPSHQAMPQKKVPESQHAHQQQQMQPKQRQQDKHYGFSG